MNISPETLKSFVDSQVADSDCGSSSEDMKRKEEDRVRVRLRRLILDGMESELIDEPIDSRYFDRLRKRIAKK